MEEMSGGDMQQYYKQLGYRASSGAVEFYYIAFRTDRQMGKREICLQGGFSWSQHLHDPAVTIQSLPDQDSSYRYSRLGPYPNRAMAEPKAVDAALQMHGDPTLYGIWGTGGLDDIHTQDYRKPYFR